MRRFGCEITRRVLGRGAAGPPGPAVLAAPLLLLLLLAGGERPAHAGPPPTFHCAFDVGCPEVLIGGDPHAVLGPGPAPFRGYGDPSLEYDPDTGALWLSYSWLDVLVSDPGPPPVIDLGVRTHLARSQDNGGSFSFQRSINQTTTLTHPDLGTTGWAIHEVSTLLREGPAAWQVLWLTYFDPLGEPPGPEDRRDFHYSRSLAASPQSLGDAAQPWVRGYATSPSFGAQHDLSAVPQLSDCVAFTEPALLRQAGETYLATNCVVFAGGTRRDDLERLVLLRQESDGYSYVGPLLTYADAVDLGATRIEQADIALSRGGSVLLIGTPIVSGGAPEHLGCVVFEITDLAAAQVRRDAGGAAVPLATITGDSSDDIIGPGLCTYDPNSDTGVLMVLHAASFNPFDVVFSLRATGVHPGVSDADGDGLDDAADPDDDDDGVSDADEPPCGASPAIPFRRPERLDGPFAGVDDDGDTAVDEALPPGASAYDCDGDGYAGSAEDHVYSYKPQLTGDQKTCREYDAAFPDPAQTFPPSLRWPGDLRADGIPDSTGKINVHDLASFLTPVMYLKTNVKTNPGDVRWDLSPGKNLLPTDINVVDMAKLIAGPTGHPPMLKGAKAFGGQDAPPCPWPP